MTVWIVASECCAGRFPQNSHAGFAYCIERSFDGIEFDVHLSSDGHVVVHHDYLLNPRIARDRSGNWVQASLPPICKLTLAEIQAFDVGRYRPGARELEEYPDYRAIDGERIPTLRTLLETYAANDSRAMLWIEIKTSPYQRDISSPPNELVRHVVDAVVSAGVARRSVLLAFEWDVLRVAREFSSEIETDYLTLNPAHVVALNRRLGPIDPNLLYGAYDPRRYGNSVPAAISAAGGDWWGPYVGDVTAHDVAEAHRLGLRVNLWNVDSNDAALTSALALNADAITLSDPDLLMQRVRPAERYLRT